MFIDEKRVGLEKIAISALLGGAFDNVKTSSFIFDENLDEKMLNSFAKANKIETIIGHLIDDLLIDSYSPKWAGWHLARKTEIQYRVHQIDVISKELDDHGIKVVILENAAIARLGYHCLGCARFGDLDFLCSWKDLEKIKEVLPAIGYRFKTDKKGRLEFVFDRGDSEVTLEVYFQTSLVARKYFECANEPVADDLIQRSQVIGGSAVRVLQNEDFLFQLVIHNASHGYVRSPGVLLHLDIHRFVENAEINWQRFEELVIRYRVKSIACCSLTMSKKLFGTKIPEKILDVFSSPRWKTKVLLKWIDKVGVFNPDEKKFSKIGYAVFQCLLYDSVLDIARLVMPSSQWMKHTYQFKNNLLLPYYYSRRILNLLFKRVM